MAGTGTAHLRPLSTPTPCCAPRTSSSSSRSGAPDSIVSAVAGISLDVLRGETLGVVGESGCGKTSLARAVMQLPPPTLGNGVVRAAPSSPPSTRKAMRAARTGMQMIFQDPIAALNPRRTVRDSRPPAVGDLGSRRPRGAAGAVVDRLLEEVGIDPSRAAESRPHEFSGGQCQRVAIARALVLEPSLVICDEPVSALDVSVQAQVLNLLEDLKASHGLSLLFIAHDLAVVKNVSDRVAVMYLGKLCEVAASELLYAAPGPPVHEGAARLDPGRPIPPSPRRRRPATGSRHRRCSPRTPCRSAAGSRPRCPRATSVCAEVEPLLTPVAARRRASPADHFVACHHPLTDGTEAVTPH